ncbi:MAG: hypothetical protein HRT61_02475 [Ekhidna sp.]|nr:hypothetical protein [Ekhidna sp.]
MLRYTFSICLLGLSSLLFGQDAKPLKKKADWRPYDLKVGFNAIRSGRAWFESDISTHEGQVALALHRYNLVLDYGFEERQRGDSLDYSNSGSYVRFGFDRNFTKNKESGNVLSLGLRYARASFEDRMAFVEDQGFGEQEYILTNDNLSARWLEIALGLRGKIVSNLYMGFTMRWQFARKVEGEGLLKTFDIPGFGKTRRQNSTAFDYYLMWRIPFKK